MAGLSRTEEIAPVRIDLSRYMGTWRVIACTDNPVEKKFVDATESYSLSDANHIDVTFKWRSETFDAPMQTHRFQGRVERSPSHAVWKMKLFPFFVATYVVIEVAPDYSWAAVAHPSRKFGWLLSRSTTVTDEVWTQAMRAFSTRGYDCTNFIRVPQPS